MTLHHFLIVLFYAMLGIGVGFTVGYTMTSFVLWLRKQRITIPSPPGFDIAGVPFSSVDIPTLNVKPYPSYAFHGDGEACPGCYGCLGAYRTAEEAAERVRHAKESAESFGRTM